MKNTLAFLFIVLAIVCHSQTNDSKIKNNKAVEYALLTGKVADTSEVLKAGNERITIFSDHTFHHKISITTPSFLSFSKGKTKVQLFVQASDSLFIDFTKDDFQIAGAGSEKNIFFQEHLKIAKQNSAYVTKNNKKIFRSELEPFNSKIDSLESTENEYLSQFLRNHPKTSKIFLERLRIDITYRNNRYRLLYPHNYHRHHGFSKLASVSTDYYENILEESLTDPELLRSKDYVRCMNYYFDILGAGEYKFHNLEFVPKKRLDIRYQQISESKVDQNVKDFFLAEHFKQNIWTYSVNVFKEQYKLFQTDCTDDILKKEVEGIMAVGRNRRSDADEIKVYRTIGGIELEAHIFYPEDHKPTDKRPAHLNFYGGGWAMGMPEWSYGACKNAAKEGRVGITFDYRLRKVYGSSIKDAVSDALFAVAWVRENSERLGIDESKILAEGFSAGGHLALSTAMIDNPEDFGVESEFSSAPNALILGSTPYDVRGRDVYDAQYDPSSISPIDLVKDGLSPMILFHGEEDNIVRYSGFKKFITEMDSTSNDFTYRSFENASHFYNSWPAKASEIRDKMTMEFLKSNGYMRE